VTDFLPFIITGISAGAVYSIAAAGLLVTYKTSGVFNFGYGALGTIAAYLFYELHYESNLNWILAFIICVPVVGFVMGLIMERIGQSLAKQSTALQIVGTVGIILLVEGLATIKFGSQTIVVSQFLPAGNDTFQLFSVNVEYSQVYLVVIGVVAVSSLYAAFRWTRIGVATRAVVDDPELLSMLGTSPIRIRLSSSVVGCVFAALSGVLLLPVLGLNATALTLLVVQAFGAAAVGSFTSLPLTFLGGILIGIGAALSDKYVVSVTWLAGLPSSLPVIILFVVLLARPGRLKVRRDLERRPGLRWQAPPRIRIGVGIAVLIPLIFIPTFVGPTKIGFYTVGLTQAILILSLGLLVRTSGQVSLCHATFAAIGAVAFSQLAVGDRIPWLLALLLAALIVVPVGALVAIPAIRLSGVFLALATFGFGILVQQLLYGQSFLFTALDQGRAMPRPSFAGTDNSYYFLVLGFFVATALLMVAVHRSRLGRVVRGMADAPSAVETMGLNANMTRVIIFSISAFMAGIAGVLYGASVHYAVSTDANFQPFNSLTLLAVLALAPFAEPWYALVAGAAAVIPGYFPGANTDNWLNVLFGVAAIGIAVRGGQPSMPLRIRELIDRNALRTREVIPVALAVDVSHQPADPERSLAVTGGLAINNLVVRFGGIMAVNGVSMKAPLGRVTGLIGPNGAGKTTTFNACSGLNRKVGGGVKLSGEDVTKYGPSLRARKGLGRTFQVVELADSLTVAENVALGREAGMAGGGIRSQLIAYPREVESAGIATRAALEMCGISDLSARQAGTLSAGQRRLVELARCLAGPFDLLLLDEPSSGLDQEETRLFEAVLRRAVEERGCGVLLVEHDMSLVLGICSYIYVLDFGKLIFEGEPAEIAASPIVQAAYLGFVGAADSAVAAELAT
jgi:ABC-type branched-subunit amino acid transport system ATPase component/branched-subunit amino acid ABC-type transport system permease component